MENKCEVGIKSDMRRKITQNYLTVQILDGAAGQLCNGTLMERIMKGISECPKFISQPWPWNLNPLLVPRLDSLSLPIFPQGRLNFLEAQGLTPSALRHNILSKIIYCNTSFLQRLK